MDALLCAKVETYLGYRWCKVGSQREKRHMRTGGRMRMGGRECAFNDIVWRYESNQAELRTKK